MGLPALNAVVGKDMDSDIRYGIKLENRNIGFNGKFCTFPCLLGFLLKRFLRENNHDAVVAKFPESSHEITTAGKSNGELEITFGLEKNVGIC